MRFKGFSPRQSGFSVKWQAVRAVQNHFGHGFRDFGRVQSGFARRWRGLVQSRAGLGMASAIWDVSKTVLYAADAARYMSRAGSHGAFARVGSAFCGVGMAVFAWDSAHAGCYPIHLSCTQCHTLRAQMAMSGLRPSSIFARPVRPGRSAGLMVSGTGTSGTVMMKTLSFSRG